MSIYVEVIHLLFVLSTALLYPVILALLLLFGWSLALLGSLISEYTSRKRDLQELEVVCSQVSEMTLLGREEVATSFAAGYRGTPRVSAALGELAQSLQGDSASPRLEKALQDAELGLGKDLEPVKIGLRVGPMLGLMGTLIPMGPALISLSQGDIRQMADSLVIAFSTTVIGLAVGGICYGVFVVRNRWYRQDLSDLEYAAELLQSERFRRAFLGGEGEASG